MKVLVLTLLCVLMTVNEAKVLKRCELARDLKQHGLEGFRRYSLDNWVCMAYYVSKFNTKAVGPPNPDGSRDYGIFQISSRWWCSDGQGITTNGCKMNCKAFLNDNINDAIECAKRVVGAAIGMNNWELWRKHCKGRNLSSWTRGCNL
ncbi:lysozyme C, milk isozyme-like [Elgaria multicarinata webbii]|uniref:lysozyme C, milk isozyme-like n=1 Tax=Elgaria multicarinata webbii TaxID=159646 RepID=UPI002FCD0E49